jgi:hypothetical protein
LLQFAAGKPVSLTKNVGSIKAFMASRAQAKAAGATTNTVQSLDGASDSGPVKKMG